MKKQTTKTQKKTATQYKTEWDFTLFYKQGLKDPKIEKDVKAIEEACALFEEKYAKNDAYLKAEEALLIVLKDNEDLSKLLSAAKPLYYLQLLLAVDSQNNKVQSLFNLLNDRVTKAGNKVVFFEINLGKVDSDTQKRFMHSGVLSKYHYFLERLFLTAKHLLSEPEEKILSLKYTTSRGMWNDYSDKLLNSQTVVWKGKKIPIPEASGLISTLQKKERDSLHKIMSEKLKEISFFSEAEMTAILTDKKIGDELRNFKKPYESRALSTQNSVEAIENVVKVVNSQNKIANDFYKLKAKFLGLKTLGYADRAVGIGRASQKMSFDESVQLFKQSLQEIDPVFLQIFERLINSGQVDVYPKKGKTGGAFCASGIDSPTFVLLNNVPNSNSFLTLAHEMGHAFHSELSKKSQPPTYQSYTLSVAEVASTFFENIAFEVLLEKATPKERVLLEFQRIQDDVSTIFRQIACFNFELAMYEEVKTKGSISKERMAELHNQSMSKYLGSNVKLNELDGYFFVQWSHLRNHFYVFTYAYGQIISKALYAEYKKDKNFIQSIIKFLSAGGSMSPDEIFRSIGIDTTKPDFFLKALKEVAADIKNLEKLARQLKMIK